MLCGHRRFARPSGYSLATLIALAGFCLLSDNRASAVAPRAIPIQARLTNTTGQPINSPAVIVVLSLYSAAQGGTAVYTETQTLAVSNGSLVTTLGNGNPTAFSELEFNTPYWLGIKVGNNAEMTPRLPLAAVPYARNARYVPDETIDSQKLAFDAASLEKVSGNAMISTGSFIGIGTRNPASQLDVAGMVRVRGGNPLEFGAGVPGKEVNAGKIGYGAFTADTLDIVGAGNAASERRIKFHAEGGSTFSGNILTTGNASVLGNLGANGNTRLGAEVNVVGNLGVGDITPQTRFHVKGNGNMMMLEGADHAYIEYYPRGFFTGRKAYIGFPAGGSHDMVIANEDGGAVRVIGTFVNNSDARLKTRIEPLRDALDAVLGLRGVSYDWRTDLGAGLPSQRQIGFLAQDVEKVLPELVYTDTSGEKAVAYINVVPVLVEALKEQQREILELREKASRVDDLAARLDALERKNGTETALRR